MSPVSRNKDPAQKGAPAVQIPDEVALATMTLLSDLGMVLDDPNTPGGFVVQFPRFAPVFSLRANKQAYGISCHALRHVRVGDRNGGAQQTIGAWLGEAENEAVTISMSDIRFAVLGQGVVREDGILGQARALLGCLRPVPALSTCQSEKGEDALTPQSTAFPASSVFRVIETVSQEAMLICDDLGDEWADYVGLDEGTHTITLYHGKHRDLTAGASAFQEVVAQALKNLGRIGVVRGDLEPKRDGWAATYRLNNVTTSIPRTRRGGTADDVVAAYERVAADPLRRARVAIVTSFLSKAELEQTIALLENQREVRRQDPQRVWLLTTFVAQCRDNGAEPLIFCAP